MQRYIPLTISTPQIFRRTLGSSMRRTVIFGCPHPAHTEIKPLMAAIPGLISILYGPRRPAPGLESPRRPSVISTATVLLTPPTMLCGARRTAHLLVTIRGVHILEPRSVLAAARHYPPPSRCRPPCPSRRL